MAVYLKQGRRKKHLFFPSRDSHSWLYKLGSASDDMGCSGKQQSLLSGQVHISSVLESKSCSPFAAFRVARFLPPRGLLGVLLSLAGLTPEQSLPICSAPGFELAPRWIGGRTKKQHQAPIIPL